MPGKGPVATGNKKSGSIKPGIGSGLVRPAFSIEDIQPTRVRKPAKMNPSRMKSRNA